MNLGQDLVNTTLRLRVLPAPEAIVEARVEAVNGRRLLVNCECALKVGAAVQLDAPDGMFLGEVLSFERGTDGSRALLDVQQTLLYAAAGQIGSRRGAPGASDSRTDPAGA